MNQIVPYECCFIVINICYSDIIDKLIFYNCTKNKQLRDITPIFFINTFMPENSVTINTYTFAANNALSEGHGRVKM